MRVCVFCVWYLGLQWRVEKLGLSNCHMIFVKSLKKKKKCESVFSVSTVLCDCVIWILEDWKMWWDFRGGKERCG